MVGLSKHAAEFFKFLLIIVEFSLAMCLFVRPLRCHSVRTVTQGTIPDWQNFLLACVFRHGGIAILLSSLANLFLMTYAGFFVNLGSIPPVLRWLRYFSTLGFALEALTVNEVSSGLMIVVRPLSDNGRVIRQMRHRARKMGDAGLSNDAPRSKGRC
jgi:hypothetical protein